MLMYLLHSVLNMNNYLEAGEDVFDYDDLLENYLANATTSDGLMNLEELLARISEVQESRIPKDMLLDLLLDEAEENGERSENYLDADNPPPQPPSLESKEKKGCIVRIYALFHLTFHQKQYV